MPNALNAYCAAVAFALGLGLSGCSEVSPSKPAPATAVSPPAPASWPHEAGDLKPDPLVVWGRLDNGLRYAILPHDNPRGRASVCLLVQAGSYQERDDELGYAHFVEHMAFRDTRDYPGDSAIETLQRLGVAFGAHVNAETSLFQTDFRLENLPSDDPGALATGLKILRSMADGILFPGQAVATEREVIFSEQRSRGGEMAQLWSDRLEFLAPRNENPRWSELNAVFGQSRLARRNPIGDESTLRAATGEKLRAFYDRWYRPERMILVIAGDIAPREAGPMIRRTFASLAARGAPPGIPPEDFSAPAPESSSSIFVQPVPTEPAMQVALCAVEREPGPDTTGQRRRMLIRQIALEMLRRRLDRLAEAPDAPFTSAETRLSHFVPGQDLVLLRADSPPAQWPKALAALDTQARQACEYGFTAAEFQRATAEQNLQAAIESRQTGNKSSAELARSLAFAVARGVVFTSAEDDRRLTEAQLATLTAGECRDALRELLPAEKLSVALSGSFVGDPPAPALVREGLQASRATALAPNASPAAARTFPYRDFGPAGRVEKKEHNALLDADLIRFANGVCLNLKRTPFEKGHVHFTVRFGGGALVCPPDEPGLGMRIFAWGLRDFSSDEEHAALPELSGWTGDLSANSQEFRFSLGGDSAGLRSALQDAAARFVHPSFREEDWPRSLEYARQQLAPYQNTAIGVAQGALLQRFSNHHPALAVPTIEMVGQRTLREFEDWFTPQLNSAPIEITLVGDFDSAAALDLVARTFGALPARARGDPYAEQRRITYPPKPFSDTVAFSGKQGVAAVVLAWPAPELGSPAKRAPGFILAGILADRLRLKLRAGMGQTYAPSAELTGNDAFTPPPLSLNCTIEADPNRTDLVAASAREVAEALAREGATPEEFARALGPLMREAESGLRNNDWWLEVLDNAQSRPDLAESSARLLADYQAATPDDINALARKILVADRQCQVIAQPEPLDAEDFSNRGADKAEKGDFAGAIADFDRAIALDPASADAHYNRGATRVQQDDYAAAITDLEKAIALNPKYAAAYNIRGAVRARRDDPTGALADYDRAIALDPNAAGTYLNRGQLREERNDHTGAIADFDHWLTLNPDNADGYNIRGNSKYAKGDFTGAIADFDHAIALNPELAMAYYNRAISRDDSGDRTGALPDYDRAIALDPGNAKAHRYRGELKEARGDHSGAIADFDRWVALEPNDPDAYEKRGLSKEANADYAGAIADLDRAISLNPNNLDFYQNRFKAKASVEGANDAISDPDQEGQLRLKL